MITFDGVDLLLRCSDVHQWEQAAPLTLYMIVKWRYTLIYLRC